MAPRRLCLAAILAARAALSALALQREPQRAAAAAGRALQRGPAAKFRQELKNQGGAGMAYTAAVTVGGQAIQGILDTGSYELLVFSATCATCGDVGQLYNGSRSRSHEHGHLHSAHTFGSGTTESRLAFEDVVIGPLRSERQYFWEVVGADLPVAHGGGFQAIVGVGPPSTPRADSLAQAERAEAMRRHVKADPTLRAPEGAKAVARDAIGLAEELTLLEHFGVLSFSVCIRREEGSGGYFIWNDEAPQQRPPGLFTAVPVVGNVTWGVRLANVRMQAVGGHEPVHIGCEGGCGALVDSGTSLLVLPTEAAQKALNAISMLHTDCSNLDALPDLRFQLGGTSFSLPPRAYVGRAEGRLPELVERYATKAEQGAAARACELLIMTMDVQTQFGPMWILGLPFFREYYTTFSLGTGIWDRANRSLFIAESDDDCHPRKPKAGSRSLAQLRHVDLSKVRLPHWATAAASAGSVML